MRSEAAIREELETLEGLIESAPAGDIHDRWEKRVVTLRWVLEVDGDDE